MDGMDDKGKSQPYDMAAVLIVTKLKYEGLNVPSNLNSQNGLSVFFQTDSGLASPPFDEPPFT